jgi:chromosome segregation ATPase
MSKKVLIARIEETETEYLLKIPYEQRDRAKAISGWRWDEKRICWVYPRTARNYDALIGEFGEDLVSLNITRPTISREKDIVESLRTENQNLRDQLGKTNELIESITKARHTSQSSAESENQTLKIALSTLEKELKFSRDRLIDNEKEKELLKQQIKDIEQEANRLLKNNAPKDFNNHLKELVKSATGGDRDFCAIIDRIGFQRLAPIEISKYLESALRNILGINDRNLKLHELIAKARDSEMLNDEAIQLAHLIRRQRNIIAHEDVDQRTRPARIVLVLFAAALLWPLLPE